MADLISLNEKKSYSLKERRQKFNELYNATVNGKLELTLLKGRQRFDTVSTSNLKV